MLPTRHRQAEAERCHVGWEPEALERRRRYRERGRERWSVIANSRRSRPGATMPFSVIGPEGNPVRQGRHSPGEAVCWSEGSVVMESDGPPTDEVRWTTWREGAGLVFRGVTFRTASRGRACRRHASLRHQPGQRHLVGQRHRGDVDPRRIELPDSVRGCQHRLPSAAAAPRSMTARPRRPSSESWRRYLRTFHEGNAGITEAVLTRSRDQDGNDPYTWTAKMLPTDGLVVDVGCGSGPMAPKAANWVGVDTSDAELRLAGRLGRQPAIAASSDALPLGDGTANSVVAVMSLMVVNDPSATLREIARVIEPRGRLIIVLPSDGPLTTTDRCRYAALLMSLGRAAMPFPHRDIMRRLPALLSDRGFHVMSDDGRRFAYPLRGRADADRLVRSLYLPGAPPWRLGLARANPHGLGPRHARVSLATGRCRADCCGVTTDGCVALTRTVPSRTQASREPPFRSFGRAP